MTTINNSKSNWLYLIATMVMVAICSKPSPGASIHLDTKWESGVLTMPCTVNGLRLRFIFDTGASSVCISATEALFMLKNGYLDESDIGGSSQSIIANGDIVDSTEITLREVVVGGVVLTNIEAVVTHGLDAPLLFGQSAIRQLGTIQIRDGEVTILTETKQEISDSLPEQSDAAKDQESFDQYFDQYKEKGWWIERDGACYLADNAPLEAKTNYYRALALTQNEVWGMMRLGYLYSFGFEVGQDYSEAFKWFRMAAENGDSWGQYNAGICLAKGLGVKEDMVEASRWFAKAAAQGNSEAQTNLGMNYQHGWGVQQDKYEAVRWYRLAAEQGNALAQQKLAACYRGGEGVQKNAQQALYWFEQSAKQGNTSAMTSIALMYEDGVGVTTNKEMALELFKQAADQGDQDAKWHYQRMLRQKEEKAFERMLRNCN